LAIAQLTFPTLEKTEVNSDRIKAILECTHADPEISQQLNVSLGHALIVSLGHALIVYRYTAFTLKITQRSCMENQSFVPIAFAIL
jgi:GntR family transcriptional regulator